jgi:hypothetical protein
MGVRLEREGVCCPRKRQRHIGEGCAAHQSSHLVFDRIPERLALRPGMNRGRHDLHQVNQMPETGSHSSGVNPWVVAVTVTLATFMEVLDAVANVAPSHIARSLEPIS